MMDQTTGGTDERDHFIPARKIDVLNAVVADGAREEIERAHREHGIVRVNIKAPLEDYREIRFFRRGHHNETVEVSNWTGFGKRSVEFGVYDDVVLLVTMKSTDVGKKRGQKP